jgi:hypothetical protein
MKSFRLLIVSLFLLSISTNVVFANYNLVVITEAGGSVTTNPTNTTDLASGTQVILTAVPNTGNSFEF